MKILNTIILLLFIITAFGYSLLFYFFHFASPENFVNFSLRNFFIKNHFTKTVMKLHDIGDARFDFASQNINLKVYSLGNLNLHPETLIYVVSDIAKVTQRPIHIASQEPTLISINGDVSDDDLKYLIKTHSNLDFINPPPLNIFLLNKYLPTPSYAGMVMNDNVIFLFMDTIKGVSDRQPTTRNAEVSTILHEFGHLMGADHVPVADCIMAESVENVSLFNVPSTIVDQYCPTDLDAIKIALE